MTLSEELKQICRNFIKDLNILYEKTKQYPLISLLFIIAVLLIVVLPYLQVSGISNVTEKVTQENQSRATLAQVFGGVAIGIGLYYTWRRISIAEEDLKATKEGQITERFTRAVDQLGAIDHLGNPAIEIRLGGIYALERIANESDKDYWPIMEVLTAYVRNNSSVKIVENKQVTNLSMDIQANERTISRVPEVRKISLDIQAILTVIKRRKWFFNNGESIVLDLDRIHLREANIGRVHLEGAILREANLEGANLMGANLEGADLIKANLRKAYLTVAYLKGADFLGANLEGADLRGANLEGTYLGRANLEGANLMGANLKKTCLLGANLEGADLRGANLEGTYLGRANIEGARNLSIDQLSKVKTLYNIKLDEELLIPLKEKHPSLFEKAN